MEHFSHTLAMSTLKNFQVAKFTVTTKSGQPIRSDRLKKFGWPLVICRECYSSTADKVVVVNCVCEGCGKTNRLRKAIRNTVSVIIKQVKSPKHLVGCQSHYTPTFRNVCDVHAFFTSGHHMFSAGNCSVTSGTVADCYSYVRKLFIEHQQRHSEVLGGPVLLLKLIKLSLERGNTTRAGEIVLDTLGGG